MRGRVRCVLLVLGCAAVACGCGSSNSATTRAQTTDSQTTAAAIAGQLTRLAQALPVSTARLPVASTKLVVERKYLTVLFDDAEATWRRDFAAAGLPYKPAHLVEYWSKIDSPCGRSDDSGPFYCSGDRTVYLDLRFFTLLVRRFGVRGVAQAYIVGHEVGHDVQNQLGISRSVSLADKADPSARNQRSVLTELEADCLAGVWGRSAYSRADVTNSELDDAAKTAAVIGDDYLAEAAGQVVDSSLWTHGSSKQRQYWLRRGFRNGRPDSCDTFPSG
jgi:predicted metalloprotease